MIPKEFLVERQGKQFVLYAGLLDLAHQQGLKRISTRLVQVPSEENSQTAIVTAEVETEKGVFSGIGDASPANVSRAMLTVTIRLAETRAKARALRDAVNVGVAALEEVADDTPEPTPIRPPETGHTLLPVSFGRPSSIDPFKESQPVILPDDAATAAQRRAIERLRGACPEHLSKAEASAMIGRLQKERRAG